MRDTRQYWIEGERWPSVTEILSLASIDEYTGIDPGILEAARRRGQEIHMWTELIDNGAVEPVKLLADVDEELRGYIRAYAGFREECKPEILACEKVVVSKRHRYVGRLDRVARLLGTRYAQADTLFDIKAAYVVTVASRLQLAGYAVAWQEQTNSKVAPLRAVLQLRADGHYRLTWYDQGADYLTWYSALRIAQFKIHHGLGRAGD